MAPRHPLNSRSNISVRVSGPVVDLLPVGFSDDSYYLSLYLHLLAKCHASSAHIWFISLPLPSPVGNNIKQSKSATNARGKVRREAKLNSCSTAQSQERQRGELT